MTIGVSNKDHGVFSNNADFSTLVVLCAMVGEVDCVTIYDDSGDRHTFREEEPREYTEEDCGELFRMVERSNEAQHGL